LFVSGVSPRASDAIERLRAICDERLGADYELEVVDVMENPEAAEDEKILATPTLIRVAPGPSRRVLGDLSDGQDVAWDSVLRLTVTEASVSENADVDNDAATVISLAPPDQLPQLIALIADGIVVVDGEGKVRLVNPAAEELLGLRGRDLIGEMFGFPIVADEATEIEIVRPGRDPIVVELRVAEGEWDGEPAFVASLRDVTERSAMVEKQNQMIERLRELDELKTEFVGMVSHDLRSPMATIAGFADTLRYNWDAFADDHKIEILERISRSTNQLARFVDNILQVNQIESGKLAYDIQAIDLKDIIDRVVQENTRLIPGQDAKEIEVRVPEDLPAVPADEMRQWQILTNLVTNGQKFSPDGDPVVIEAGLDGDSVRISVRDSGFGINKEDMEKLFKKFSRLEQPPGMKVKGTGLGLYICKAMIEAQGGRVWVESEPGNTTFNYTIPVSA